MQERSQKKSETRGRRNGVPGELCLCGGHPQRGVVGSAQVLREAQPPPGGRLGQEQYCDWHHLVQQSLERPQLPSEGLGPPDTS